MSAAALGATLRSDDGGATFSVRAPAASRVEVWLFGAPMDGSPAATAVMQGSAAGVFTATVNFAPGGDPPLYYGYRAWGPNWPYDPTWTPGSSTGFVADVDSAGNRFNPNKLLLDPHTLEVSHCVQTPAHPDRSDYETGAASRHIDTGPFAPKGLILAPIPADFGVKPSRPFKDEIIYEVHARGFTKADPDVPATMRGTYAGAGKKAAYLRDLGVTAIEFLPVHQTQNGLNDLAASRSQQDYWGYVSMSYFAPDRRYARDQSPGGPTREWIAMVKAFHDVGLKVYIDVVFNHHEEPQSDSDPSGMAVTIYSLRGLDNPGYYETNRLGRQPQFYQNDNGVGPNLNAATETVRDLVLASLTYWAGQLGVDGFRFDLAAVLGNECPEGGYHFVADDPDSILNRAVRLLPARPAKGGAGVDLIAEPYTADGNGQEQGNFPVGWAEWNDRFRDTMRAAQNKLGIVPVTPGSLATRLAGSSDLFQSNGRRPWNSVNYIVCHDGFTLNDLHTYDKTNNDQPYPYGPSPGGRAAAQEMCWDHGGDPARQQQAIRTSIALVFLAAGVPMITGGTEMNRTQYGNNNAFNLDTSANWLDWSLAKANAPLVTFTRTLAAFRVAHPALRPSAFFTGMVPPGGGIKDLTWYENTGREVDEAYFGDSDNHFLAYQIDGLPTGDSAVRLYIGYNGWIDPIAATLPSPPQGLSWYQVMDTSVEAASWGFITAAGRERPVSTPLITIGATSVALLILR